MCNREMLGTVAARRNDDALLVNDLGDINKSVIFCIKLDTFIFISVLLWMILKLAFALLDPQ